MCMCAQLQLLECPADQTRPAWCKLTTHARKLAMHVIRYITRVSHPADTWLSSTTLVFSYNRSR